MPWTPSGIVDERGKFVQAHKTGLWSMTELCSSFGISRKTGYKFLARYGQHGLDGLRDWNRAPLISPQRMRPEIEELLLNARARRTSWGPLKILARLAQDHPELADELPAASTAGALFKRHGLIRPRTRRNPRNGLPLAGALHAEAPNEVWSADFKGEFRMGDRAYCYPFTVSDAFSRYLLGCRGEKSTHSAGVRQGLIDIFRTNGLPRALRTDNGPPFVAHGGTELTSIGVFLIQLGIRHQRIKPGRPDQNGRHERMHRTLKAETARPPEVNLSAQQKRFDAFRTEYNQERPHEALGQRTPASQYSPSPKPYPETLPQPEYPGHSEPRKVNKAGSITFRSRCYFLAHPLAAQWVCLIEIDDDIWSVRFYDTELGRINSRTGTCSIKVLPMSPV